MSAIIDLLRHLRIGDVSQCGCLALCARDEEQLAKFYRDNYGK